MCGAIGRTIIQSSAGRYKLFRISALDPSLPYYYPAQYEKPISKNDADFVDAIHSDTFYVGSPYRVGHVDFYPNNGKIQKGCPSLHVLDPLNSWVDFNRKFTILFLFSHSDYCSHFQAFRFWAKSLISERVYPAKQCSSWKNFKSRRCEKNPTNFMGFAAQPNHPGVFYNDIESDENLFQDENARIYEYFGVSFNKRSTISKFLRKLGIDLSWLIEKCVIENLCKYCEIKLV